MLIPVEIKERELHLYKQPDAWVEPGNYLIFRGKPGQAQKKILELKAVQKPSGQFMWIAPNEFWVKRIENGWMEPVPNIDEEPGWEMLSIKPEVLRTWQKEFIREVWNYLRTGLRYGKGWIARVGGGKTLAGLCAMDFFNPAECVVVVERYLHETWRSEAEKWGFPAPQLSTPESAHKIDKSKIKCVIIDECLRLKNPEAKRSKHVEELTRFAELVVGFTGVPTGGKGPMDFRWLRIINKGSVPSSENAWKFYFGLDTELKEVGPNKAYVTTKWDRERVSRFIAPYIRTVDPAEIIAELPEIQFHFITCGKPAQFDLVKTGGATASGTHKRLAQVMQCTDGFVYDDNDRPIRFVSPKMDVVDRLVEDIGEPVILVTNWSDCVDQLSEKFAHRLPAVIRGGADFASEISRFKTGGTDILIANAGFSKGMNLQGVSSTIIFLSTSTKPDDYEQMLGRVHRPGQKNGVNIYHLCCEDTLDRRRVELVQQHKGVSEDFIIKLLMEEFENV